ncbi:MAG: flagellar protein FlgN [Candidatus Zixiibacteriota bacterium]
MSQALNDLIETLSAEAELFETALELLDRQRDMIVANDTDGLMQVTEAQREKLVESKLLDKKRRELVDAVAADSHLSGDITVSRLLESVSPEVGLRLSGLRDAILDLNEKIEEGKERNRFLINKSRDLIAESLKSINRMSNPSEKGSAYQRTGTSMNSTPGSPRISLAMDKRI